jgi:RHS repeat-associated protein
VISSYAPDGDVLAMTDAVMGPWTYSYDGMNRLTSGTAKSGVENTPALTWAYDRYGNRWTQTATGTGNASAVQPNLAFYGNNNQVSGWDYDAAGNLTNDNRNTYAYDAEGRITSLNSAPTYAYDAEGRRVAKLGSGGTVATSYILGLGGEQVAELNASGGWKHSNVWAAGGRLLATYEGPAGTDTVGYHFHLTDWLGTQRMQTTAAGNQEEECYSYPFGDGLTCTGTDATEHHFTGKERDAESGLDYFGARYLSSNLGRFMTPDWAAKPTAVPYALFGDPQSLNLYAYAYNNPNLKVDLDGHAVQTAVVYVYYQVSGNSAAEATQNANAHFKGADGKTFAGLTTAKLTVSYNTADKTTTSNGTSTTTSTVKSDTVTKVTSTVELPQWSGPGHDAVSPAEKASFDSKAGKLKDHELQHVSDNNASAAALDKTLPGTTATATGKTPEDSEAAADSEVSAEVGAKTQGALSDMDAKAKVLDDNTNHGVN